MSDFNRRVGCFRWIVIVLLAIGVPLRAEAAATMALCAQLHASADTVEVETHDHHAAQAHDHGGHSGHAHDDGISGHSYSGESGEDHSFGQMMKACSAGVCAFGASIAGSTTAISSGAVDGHRAAPRDLSRLAAGALTHPYRPPRRSA